LLPGPQPPLTHFGATLLRHVILTGLRYTLYHLGLPLPDRAPIRIDRLRPEIDGPAVDRLLGATPGGRAVAGALVDPAGSEGEGERSPTGAAFFHRQRLRWARHRDLPRLVPTPADGAATLEYRFREHLSACLPVHNDALLDEVLCVLRRRAKRRQGLRPAPAVGPAAAAWIAGREACLERLGSPDPFTGSWATAAPEIARPDWTAHRAPGRGRFREMYRQALDGFRPTLTALADRALRHKVLNHPDDLFFLPFELLGDLTLAEQPAWLPAAILRNRAEYFGLARGGAPEERADWDRAPLRPLP
jgi:hypothetical protein